MTEQTIQERESVFWDEVVARADDDDASLVVGPDDLYDRTMPWLGYLDKGAYVQEVMDTIGVRPGLRVLDLGCGKGFLSIALAHRGCEVTGIDISPKSIQRCEKRAALSGVSDKVTFQVMDCERTEFAEGSFDAVCGSFVLHHLNLDRAGAELSRLLKPGGRAACIETMGLNPLLMAARATLPGRFGIEKASSDDEYPLTSARLRKLAAGFDGKVDARFPKVVFLRMGGYVSFLNNAPMRALFKGADSLFAAIPPLRRWSYYGVVALTKTGPRTDA